jgi:hypothetical protein
MRIALPVALGLAAAALAAPPARADVHRDEDLGFTMAVPRGWKRIPLPMDERWIVAKYLSERKYPSKDGWEHVPEIRVIYFPAGRDLKAKEERKVEKVGDNITISTSERNYRDFKDYLKENNSGSGFYVSREEEAAINGIPATVMEIKWEKLTTPRRALAVVFHRDVGADYAVTFEVLEEQWDKLGRELGAAVRTFKFIEAKKDLRAGAAAGEGAKPPEGKGPGEGKAAVPGEPGKDLTPEEREKAWEESRKQEEEHRRRKRAEKLGKEVEHARSSLPKGWRESKSKNFVCFTHAEEKYTRRVLDQAEGMRAWLDRTFGSVGSGEVATLLLRICENREEESSFSDTSRGTGFGGFWGGDIDFTTNQEEIGSSLQALGWMNGWVMRNWFSDRQGESLWGLPDWIRSGLDGYVSNGVVLRGRFDFRPDASEISNVRRLVKEGSLLTARDLMTRDWSGEGGIDELLKGNVDAFEKAQAKQMQCQAFVRYLLDGPGAADKRTKGRILAVLRACREIEDEEDRQSFRGTGRVEGDAEKAPETEEEEEAQAKKREEEQKKESKARMEEVVRRAFQDLTDADWAAIDRQWRAFAAQYQ